MDWFKVVFVMVMVSRLDSIQNEIKKTDSLSKTEHEFPTACPLSNFTVTQVFNEEPRYINLKLSWDKVEIDDVVDISIREVDFDENKICLSEMDVLNHSLLKNSILEPDMVTEDEVYPGCKYDIVLYSRGGKGRIYCSYNYTVPECEHCDNSDESIDCVQFKPFPEILSVEFISGNKFLVKWNFETFTDSGSNIKQLSFEYIQASNNHTKQAELIRNDFQERTSEIIMDLLDEENYMLIGTFEYNLSCWSKQKFDFIAPRKSNYFVTIIIFILVVLITILVIWKYKSVLKFEKKRLKLQENARMNNQQDLVCIQAEKIPMKTNLQYHSVGYMEGLSDEYEFPRSRIIIKEIIGSGAFGQVFSAKAIGIGGDEGYRMVAIKTLGRTDAVTKEATNDFIAEIEIFKKVGHHPNIVTLLGCCTLDAPYMMIMEFVPCGDLKKYLLELRTQWLKKKNIATNRQVFFPDGTYVSSSSSTTPDSITPNQLTPNPESMSTPFENLLTPLLAHYTLDKVLDHTELQNFALQIAKGMAHLETISITHRDLAARNILISEFKTLKISDFGLSRSGPYINHKTKKLPLRWMAIEAIVQQKYDSRSDVWSFGVVLWEIGTLGAFPYESVPDSFIQQFLQLGKRLERPEICTDELYSLMERCWSADPEQRPSFRELVEALDVKKRKVYVDFDRLSPGYVFPPSG